MSLEIIIGALITASATIFSKVLEKPESRKVDDDLKDFCAFLKEVEARMKEERVMWRQAPTLHLKQLANILESLAVAESSGSDPRQLCFFADNIQALKDELTSIFDGSKISSPSQGPRPEQTISEQPGQSSIATKARVMGQQAPTRYLNQLANVFESLAESSDLDSGLLRLVANNIGDHKDEITSISNGSKISSPKQGPRQASDPDLSSSRNRDLDDKPGYASILSRKL